MKMKDGGEEEDEDLDLDLDEEEDGEEIDGSELLSGVVGRRMQHYSSQQQNIT